MVTTSVGFAARNVSISSNVVLSGRWTQYKEHKRLSQRIIRTCTALINDSFIFIFLFLEAVIASMQRGLMKG
jgi:hypothetical protein